MKRDANITSMTFANNDPTPAAYRYDAFISYSHDHRQSAITAALQQAVQRFAKPFWRRRAVNLFRDQTNLSANPDLWETIVGSLRNSRYLILVASPKAAESPWVAKEIKWWLENRGSNAIIIVLATGSMHWSDGRFSDAGTTALPILARTAFSAEPLWLDLSGIAIDPMSEGWQQDPRFLDGVASISSCLRSISKEDLFGEDLRRHRETQRAIWSTIATISTLLAVAIAAAVFANEKRREAEQRADETAAAHIWSRLDFENVEDPRANESVQSLWNLATASEGVQEAFLRQLALDRHQVATLAVAPASIARAFGIHPGDPDFPRLLDPVVDAIRHASEPSQLYSPAQAAQVYNLAQTAQALASKLAPEQAQAVLGPLLDAVGRVTDPGTLQVLAQVVNSLGPMPEQTQIALGPILAAIRQTSDPQELRTLAWSVQYLALTPDQTQEALDPILDVVRRTADSNRLIDLAQAVWSLAPGLAPEQAQTALGPVLDATRRTTDPDSLRYLAQAVQTLGPSPEQAWAALGPGLQAIRETTDPDTLQSLAQAVQALGPMLAPDQARAALGPLLDASHQTSDPDALQALAEAVQSLGPTPEQALTILDPVLAAVRQTTDRDTVQPLAQAIQSLAPRLAPEHAQAALGPVLDVIRQASDPNQLWGLAMVVRSLSPTPEQARAALSPVLDAIRQTTDVYSLHVLAQAVNVLGPRFAPEQTQVALGSVLDAIRQTSDPNQLWGLAMAIRSLKPTTDQAQTALDPILEAIPQATDPARLRALARAIQFLGPALKPQQAEDAIEASRILLAATHEPGVAADFARAIAVSLPAEPVQHQVAALIELLKWPTTGAPGVSDALLEVLHERVPGAPGKEDGLDATVQWVAATYPDIDLDSPPICPAIVCGDTPRDSDWLAWFKGLAEPIYASVTTAIAAARHALGIAASTAPPTS